MADDTQPKLESIAPVFMVTDVRRAAAYYTGMLLFEIAFEWADEDGGPVRYVIVKKDDCVLHLSQAEAAREAVAYIGLRGISDYYDSVRAAGANVTEELQDWPWGMREFETTDPDGNRLIFGEDIPQERIG